MRHSLASYYRYALKNFFEALINILIFLPYFFSIPTLLKTLFIPWKNLVTTKTGIGFSWQEWFNRMSGNMVSRLIGFFMRLSLITFYFILQIMYFLLSPLLVLLALVFIPFFYFWENASHEEQKKEALKQRFIAHHMLNQEHYSQVNQWFENYYKRRIARTHWWKLSELFLIPPLARDWTMGFTPTVDEYTQDLSSVIYQSHIKHIVGREKEINQIERILSKNEEANVLIVGDEGVGKHTIVDSLAKKIYEGRTNSLLLYKRILMIDMEKVLDQYTDHKQREEFLKELFSEAAAAKNIILLIGNIDKYVVEGDSRLDLTSAIEAFAKLSTLQIIGITTPFLYDKYIVHNEKIQRLFTKIDVYEVSKEAAQEVLLEQADTFELRHKVYIPYETITASIEKSDFYITTIPFPEKAMQLLDNACIYTNQTLKQTTVMPETIDFLLSEKNHVPTTLSADLRQKLLHLENTLGASIIHQEEATQELAAALRRSFLLMGKRKKPLASLLFIGPTGVGKTETAKVIAQIFFNSASSLIRFDMSLYQSISDIPKLIGSNETQEPGLLSHAIAQQPYGVLLLDEIEKAHSGLINIFLTLLDEGYFTDGFGKKVDCKNLVVIATSNAGSDFIYHHLSTHPSSDSNAISSRTLVTYLIDHHIFSPEFLNRFDDVVAYKPLLNDSLMIIAQTMVKTIAIQLKELYKVTIEVNSETLKQILAKNTQPEFGARNLDRLIRKELEDKVAKLILEQKVKEGETIYL